MKTMVERFREQRDKSQRFTEDNFGLMVGDSFPELFREFLADDRIAASITVEMIRVINTDDKAIKEAAMHGKISEIARKSGMAVPLLSWLYWGMEIGREIEREALAESGQGGGRG